MVKDGAGSACRILRRCFEFFLNFQGCMADSVDRKKCNDYMDDYYECMHHKKEAERWRMIEKEWVRPCAPLSAAAWARSQRQRVPW